MKKYLTLSDITAYSKAITLNSIIWNIVLKWDIFTKRTVGEQLVKSADSIGANIAEGFGRYFKNDKIRFYYYARGSILETEYWIERAYERQLLQEEAYEKIKHLLSNLPKNINAFIKITRQKL